MNRSSTRSGASTNGLTVVDLFAGAGGLSCAFHQAGFSVIAAAEKDPNACGTYRVSFMDGHSPDTELFQGDLADPEALVVLRRMLGRRRVDVVVGGPPCQDFSPARLRKKPVAERMHLVHDYLRILATLQPRAFLFENVPGLLRADGGRTWRSILEGSATMGHRVFHQVLDAQEHGVPQRRKRLFVVGIEEESAAAFSFPEPSGYRKTVWEIIGSLPRLDAGEADSTDPDHRARSHRQETVEYLAQIPQGGSWRSCTDVRTLPCHRSHNGHYDVYGRMEAHEVAPTLTGGCTNPSRGRFIHPFQHRGLTIREAALLQTFPPSWHFCGGIESATQQVGNAVPVELGRRLAQALAETLRGRAPVVSRLVPERGCEVQADAR
ncbi:MAG: DNA cytosine methyltransferase [Pseudomonadota bacterium]